MEIIALTVVTVKGSRYAVGLGPAGALVSSRSEPGRTHQVTAAGCDCIAYTYRRRCAHTQAVSAVWQQQHAAEQNSNGR